MRQSINERYGHNRGSWESLGQKWWQKKRWGSVARRRRLPGRGFSLHFTSGFPPNVVLAQTIARGSKARASRRLRQLFHGRTAERVKASHADQKLQRMSSALSKPDNSERPFGGRDSICGWGGERMSTPIGDHNPRLTKIII